MDGTPVDTSSCALCSEGRDPRGCWGPVLAPLLLKLVAMQQGSEFNISIFLVSHN